MESQYLSIQKLSFEISYFSKEKAYELQNRVSRLYHHQVHQTLEDFFDRAIPQNELLRKDNLVLDLGTINEEQLENELCKLIMNALEEQFSSYLVNGNVMQAWDGQQFERLPVTTGAIALLKFYLVHGYLPWQSSAEQGFTWQGALHQLYQKDRGHLRELLEDSGRHQQVRKRLAYQSGDDDFEMILFTIAATEAPAILVYQKKIVKIQQEQQVIKANPAGFREAVSFFILTYLLEEKGSLFSMKEFIKSVLIQLAAHYNIAYLSLLDILAEALPQDTSSYKGRNSLFELISELQQEETPERPKLLLHQSTEIHVPSRTVNDHRKLSARVQHELAELLDYFLQYGGFPWWADGYQMELPETLFIKLYDQSPEEAIGIFKKAGQQRRSRHRFLWQFSEPLVYQIFSHLPQWNQVGEMIEHTLGIIESMADLKLGQLSLKHLLMEAVWTAYMAEHYLNFNALHFYQSIFKYLHQFTAVAHRAIVRHFKAAGVMQHTVLETAVKGAADEALRVHQPSTDILDHDLLPASNSVHQLSAEDRLQQAVDVLQYFLTSNAIPEHLSGIDKHEFDQHLTAMMLILYRQNRDALKRMMQNEKHAAAARMRLHQLFLPDRKGGDHKQLSLLIEEYADADALRYVKEVAYSGDVIGNEVLKPALDRLLKNARSERKTQLALLLNSAPLTSYIIHTYGDGTMDWMIANVNDGDKTFNRQVAAISHILMRFTKDTFEKQQLRHLLNDATRFYFSSGERPQQLSTYMRTVFRFLAGSPYISITFFTALLDGLKNDKSMAPAQQLIISLMVNELEQLLHIRSKEEALEKKLAAEMRSKQEALLSAQQIREKTAQELLRKRQQEELTLKTMEPSPVKAQKLYISNAGLVLLHPFISTYFSRLNLLEDGKFTDHDKRIRAVHLLQYLAFGSSTHPEHELVLNKILCNFPLQEPLPLTIIMEPHEEELSAELLQVVIDRSGKLSSSSIAGFRASFIQRDGIITETEENWILRVEQRSYDIILQTLPWGFGMIKFQWMNKPLLIEWT